MEQGPVVYGWIFARGGSKGLPGKNIRMLGDYPLIAHAIRTAQESKWIRRIFLSTDDDEIAEVARDYGAEVPFLRPPELASDDAPERLAWRHAVNWVSESNLPKMDIMVSLSPTSPLRTADEVDQGIRQFLKGGADTVVAVSRSNRHPSFNVVHFEHDGMVRLVNPPPRPGARRQDFPPVFDISTAFYITTPSFVLDSDSYWAGRVGAIEIPVEHAIDIDEQIDFDFAEFLIQKRAAE